jgi:hypothetical protein
MKDILTMELIEDKILFARHFSSACPNDIDVIIKLYENKDYKILSELFNALDNHPTKFKYNQINQNAEIPYFTSIQRFIFGLPDVSNTYLGKNFKIKQMSDIDFVENMNIDTYYKLLFLLDRNNFEYIKEHTDSLEIDKNYELIFKYDTNEFLKLLKIIPNKNDIIFSLINEIITRKSIDHIMYIICCPEQFQDVGYDILIHKDALLKSIVNKHVDRWYEHLQFLLENGAKLENNQRKKNKSDSKRIIKLFETYGVSSV